MRWVYKGQLGIDTIIKHKPDEAAHMRSECAAAFRGLRADEYYFVKESGLVYAMQGVGRAHWHKTQNK